MTINIYIINQNGDGSAVLELSEIEVMSDLEALDMLVNMKQATEIVRRAEEVTADTARIIGQV